jgi:hypothetical protein
MSQPEPKPTPDAAPAPGEVVPPSTAEGAAPLTPEEQMARFEEELKFDDWGHQPC